MASATKRVPLINADMDSIEQINYIKAPAEVIYDTLVNEEGLSQIWTRKLTVRAEIGFVNKFDFNEGYITEFKVKELQENRWILWKCIASDEEWTGTGLSFKLTEKDSVTTVYLNHSNWRARTDYFRWCSYNWALFLYRLKNHCEGTVP
jgi:uncharacterized protein YndB with AHSA1/START domain